MDNLGNRLNLIVTGSRAKTFDARIEDIMWTAATGYANVTLYVGDANGVDALARKVAEEAGWDIAVFRADWKKHGKAAGPIRNQQIADAVEVKWDPAVGLAFPDEGSKGTWDMVRRMHEAAIPVLVVW